MEKEKLIQIQWHVERSGEQTQYMLISQDPDYPDLKVSIGSDEVSERVAKARLIEKCLRWVLRREFRPAC